MPERSEACANVISIIADDGQEGLRPAEKGTLGIGTLHSGEMEWINMKVQQINGTERSSTPRLEQEGCVGRECGMKLEKEAGRITPVI